MFGINYDPSTDNAPLPDPTRVSGTCTDGVFPNTVPPHWITPPPDDSPCPVTGLARATFQVKVLGAFADRLVTVSLRQSSADRGKQLVFAPSLHDLLLSLTTRTGETLPPPDPNRFERAKNARIPRRWIRAPKNSEVCGFCGLGHYSFYGLLESAGAAIQVAQLRLPGETRASRQIWLPSLHHYLLGKAMEQAAKSTRMSPDRASSLSGSSEQQMRL
jgi:hypothetical protein